MLSLARFLLSPYVICLSFAHCCMMKHSMEMEFSINCEVILLEKNFDV
jgi:hypothetical protein